VIELTYTLQHDGLVGILTDFGRFFRVLLGLSRRMMRQMEKEEFGETKVGKREY